MEISPQTIRSTGFKTVKKGYDPDEVEAFRAQVAIAVESAQNQATSMEARARAAVAKLQELSQQVNAPGREAAAPVATTHTGDTEMISRTLLLAQRTADAALADARVEAEGITAHAREEAARVLDSARTMAAKTVEDARADARRAVDDERVKAENEVQALLARRDFLLGDVDHLEQYLQAQRERLRDAAVQLQELVDRVPGGLGDMRRPLLSASAEPLPERPAATPAPAPAGAAPERVVAEPAVTPGLASLAASIDEAPITEQVPIIAPTQAHAAPVVDLD
ncbi:MAG: DivIVA domain-containing protein, partial [Ilumatobacteraceae bacterium]